MADIGAEGHAELVVAEEDSSRAFGSGDLDVLATPRLGDLMERAALAALDGVLSPDQTTVGVRLDVRHSTATPLGHTVRATARLIRRKGPMFFFAVRAEDDAGEVAEGAHHRLLVNRDTFMATTRRRYGGR